MIKKTAKPKKLKHNGFDLPPKSGPKSTKCAKYIYEMIKEAKPELLDREDVKKAFNDFVACLRKYDTLESYTYAYSKYTVGIKIEENTESKCIDNFKALNCKFNYENDVYRNIDLKTKLRTECFDVVTAYVPLYDLIKRDIIPYMELKNWVIRSKKEIEYFHRLIEREEATIKHYEKSIERSRQFMCDYAKKALAWQDPPVTTSFE